MLLAARKKGGVMSHVALPVAGKGETGRLGVVYLKRLWSLWVTGRQAAPEDVADDWRATNVLFSGLRLGIEETLRAVIAERMDFDRFEQWILARNGGAVEPAVVARLNAALTGAPPPSEAQARIDAIDAMAPVLSEADLAHWHEHGYVVLRQAIDAEACRAGADAIWQAQGMSPDDPDGWNRRGEHQQCVFVQVFRHPVLDANRRSDRIHKAFAQLWGNADLWVSTDRVGFNPPVTPSCPFPGPGIHWDVSLARPIPLGIQGLIYLTDTATDQGAFALVPGMHRTIDCWLDSLPPGISPQHHAEASLTMTPIPGQAGDMVIWHHALAHGPTPNHARVPRLVQYIKLFPADFGFQPEWR